MAVVKCRTHITHRLITRSLFFTHTFLQTPTHQLLVHFMHTLMHFLNMPVVIASYFASCLLIRCSFFHFSLLGSQSEVTCVRHFPINLNSVRCNSLLYLSSFMSVFFIVVAGLGKILNLKMVCLSVHELKFELKSHEIKINELQFR